MINIIDKSDCCGCTACSNICPKKCITMQEDKEGFSYPVVDKTICVDCKLCEKVCPIINYKKENKHPEIYGLKHKNLEIRKRSTSGGGFFSLAEYTIERNGIVFGAAYDNEFHVLHLPAYSIEDCKKFHGAKYVESYLSDGLFVKIKGFLEENREVLFVGTPCQVAGLRGFLRKDYPNLLTCDLICSSVPSPKIFHDYLTFVQRRNIIQTINMRWKGKGWNKSNMQIIYANGKELIGKGDAKLWLRIAFTHLVSRPSCHHCRFSNFNRPGDFTIGDFWGVEKSHPLFFDKDGISLAFINSEKGKKVFESIKKNFYIQPSEENLCKQPRLFSPVKPHPLRKQFWNEYDSKKFDYIARKYWKYGILNQIKDVIYLFLSRMYSIIKK